MDEYLYFSSLCHIYIHTRTGSLARIFAMVLWLPVYEGIDKPQKQYMVLQGPKLLLELGLPESFCCNWKLCFGLGSVVSKGTEASKRLHWIGSSQNHDSSRGDELIFVTEWESAVILSHRLLLPAAFCALFSKLMFCRRWTDFIYIHMRGKQNQVREIQTL